MGQRDPRIDAYIARSAEFARPILEHIREAVHSGCPEVQETLKWGMPYFMYKGMLCNMASFKNHCTFGFWKGSLVAKKHKGLAAAEGQAMGQLGRISKLADLPGRRTLVLYVKEAAALNDEGVRPPRRPKPRASRALRVPDFFMAALKKNKTALATFEAFSVSHKREYVDWVTEAKTEATRARRLETAIAWMSEGKARNWKYVAK